MVGVILGLGDIKDGLTVLVTTDPRDTIPAIWTEITSRSFLAREIQNYKIALRNEGSRGRVIYSELLAGGVMGKVGKLGKLGKVGKVAASAADDLIDLTGHRARHILNRHRRGAGISGKSEFPADWTDSEILHHVSDIATDPNAVPGVGKWDSPYVIGVRDGVEIRVDFYPPGHPLYAGKISTAYPINAPLNP